MVKTDQELLQKAQDGSLQAFEALVVQYQGKIIRFIEKFVRSTHVAEDLTQDTFLSFYKNVRKVDSKKKLSTYLFEIAKNKAFSYHRKYGRILPLNDQYQVHDEEKWISNIDREHTKKRVAHALKKIDEKYKRVITLYYFEHFDYQKISKKLNIPLNTVRTLLHRAKEHLKKHL